MISFTFCNGLLLISFASMLASCQKANIKMTGHFSKFKRTRSIASLGAKKSFDPKQVYLYCSVNSVDMKNCYSKSLEKHSIKTIKSFPAVKIEVDTITDRIISTVKNDISKKVENRKAFCMKNSEYYFEKCLTQYVERDSMATLNKYQKSNPGINGYEYIHLKRSIASVYSDKLENYKNDKVDAVKKK